MTTGRLAVLSNVNMNMVIRMLQKNAQVYEAEGYGNELGTLLNPQSSYHAYHAEITFLIMDLAELLEHDLDPVTAEQKIGNWFRTLEGCLPQEGVFYVSDAYLWAVELAVLADTGRKSQLEGIWERELRNLQQKHANVRSFPYRALTEHFGEEKAFSPKMWYMGKVLWGMEMQSALAEQILYRAALVYRTPKKVLVLDLDNTLWGGIVGDDGPENLEIGQETNLGQVYAEFQSYVKSLKDYGVMLNVASKNEEENALAGLNHPAGVLKPEDFLIIAANWEPKSRNILEIAHQLNILPDSLVFADDNPAEREIVRQQAPGVTAPEIGKPEDYIRVLDRGGYFEVTSLSEDDRKRNEMYQANLKREKAQASFADYAEYLKSLDMKATIRSFEPVYMARIAQLTNKSNQFNLTTQRMTQAQIEQMAADDSYITLYGKLEDKFGDNGVVSVVIAKKEEKAAHIRLWLMSCRVLKRDMELAMLDEIVERCQEAGIEEIYGYYYPTAKNNMVRKFYGELGFEKCSEDEAGNSVWKLNTAGYEKRNHVIEVES